MQANAQDRTCASHDVLEHQIKQNPNMAEKNRQLEAFTQNYIKQTEGQRGSIGNVVIPCVVHIVYANSQQNISAAQVQSQIDRLNVDYAGSNTAEYSGMPSEFAGVAAGNTGIQFELLEVRRYADSRASWGTNDDVKLAYPPVTPESVLNMWVCEIGGGILGYAQFPNGPANTDGVVMSPQYFGDITADDGSFFLAQTYDLGRTATHEVGHWLNLRHIWGDGSCRQDDFVDDTPVAGSANYGCPSYPTNSCRKEAGNDMTMNYMDYTNDACMYMFTAGQQSRMEAALVASRPGFLDSNNGGDPGTGDPGTGELTENCGQSTNISVGSKSWNYYTVDVPAGATQLAVSTSGGRGDVDLYISLGSTPTTGSLGSAGSNNNESISITNPGAGTWEIGIYGYRKSSGITLDVCFTAPAAARGTGESALKENGTAPELNFVELSLFPNPANNQLNVVVDNSSTIEVFSITGQKLMTVAESNKNQTIDISGLGSGVYILKATNEKGVFTKRFIKK